jgi:hypothetical protein
MIAFTALIVVAYYPRAVHDVSQAILEGVL